MAATDGDSSGPGSGGGRPEAPAHVGVHVANVLNAAEEAADEIRAAARAEADVLLARARAEAADARREADAAAEKILAEAQELGQGIIATAHGAARAIEEVALDRQARLRLQVRALETQLADALAALRALDAGLLDPVPDDDDPGSSAVDLERLVESPSGELGDGGLRDLVTKRGERWIPARPPSRALDRDELLDRARELGITGRLRMTTEELLAAVEARSGRAG